MDNKNQQAGQQMQIEVSPEVARGIYSNFAVISHSHAEFVVDCASMLPGQPKAQWLVVSFSLRSTQSVLLWLFRRISCVMSLSSVQSISVSHRLHRDLVPLTRSERARLNFEKAQSQGRLKAIRDSVQFQFCTEFLRF